MNVTRVTLELRWNDKSVDHPAEWNWADLIGVSDPKNVKVVKVEEVE